MQEFDGKVAVITGAASGIGRAVAQKLAELGMSVVLADFEQEALDATAAEFRHRELNVLPVLADVARPDSLTELRDRTVREFGTVHLLMNNAGVADATRVPIWESRQEDWNWMYPINFWGVVDGIRTFVPLMLANGEPGHVVNTASVAGLLPGAGIYGISKQGVVAVTEALYYDLEAAGAKVHASVLCPPFVKTRIFESARNRPGAGPVASLATDEILNRAMEVDAIADAVVQGIRDEQLYIWPHSEFDPVIEARYQSILARRNLPARMAPVVAAPPRP